MIMTLEQLEELVGESYHMHTGHSSPRFCLFTIYSFNSLLKFYLHHEAFLDSTSPTLLVPPDSHNISSEPLLTYLQ